MPVLLSYRNQSIGLHRKSTDWFLHKGNTDMNAQFMISSNLQKSPVNVFLMRNIKKHCYKKKSSVFLNLGEENF